MSQVGEVPEEDYSCEDLEVLEDIIELKTQFEEEASQLTKRIEELAKHFEEAAEEYKTEKTQPAPTSKPPEEKQNISRRKSGFSKELTLDD